jgi:hypothetical protein
MSSVPLVANPHMPEVPPPGASPNERFLAGTVPHGADDRLRFGNSFLVSLAAHVAGVLLIAFVMTRLPPAASV